MINVTATAGGMTSSQNFVWRVGTVVVTPPADQTATEGESVSLAVSAAALSGTLTYSAVRLPTGLSINSNTGVISGTIAAGAAANGPYTPTVVAANGTMSNSQTFNFNVNPAVSVTDTDDQSNVEGDSVSVSVTASEPGATLSYSAAGLPAGLCINSSTGVISGTVSAGDSANSPYTVDVTVGDGTYNSDDTFEWAISNGSSLTPTLANPGAQVNAAGDNVNLAISASGPSGNTLSYSAAGLPDGLNIDPSTGIISGTVADDATSTTPSNVTVTVEDNNSGTTTSQSFVWMVNTLANAGALTVAGGVTEGIGAGEILNATWASFTDSNVNLGDSDFTATINWGDGSASSQGTIDGSDGLFVVSGSHTYASMGAYPVTVTVTAEDGGTGSDTSTAQVGNIVAGVPATLTVATFSSSDPSATADDFQATISWGDGAANSAGTVTESGGV